MGGHAKTQRRKDAKTQRKRLGDWEIGRLGDWRFGERGRKRTTDEHGGTRMKRGWGVDAEKLKS
jgi:hypothetical protein